MDLYISTLKKSLLKKSPLYNEVRRDDVFNTIIRYDSFVRKLFIHVISIEYTNVNRVSRLRF